MWNDPVRRQTLLILLGILAAAVLGLWWPSHQKAQLLHRRLYLAQAAIQAAGGTESARFNDLAQLARRVLSLRRELDQSLQTIPPQSELAELIRHLARCARQAGLQEHQLISRPLQENPDYVVLPLRLEFQGSFPQIFQLISRIESMPQILRLTHLEVTTRSDKAPQPLQGFLEFYAFFQSSENAP